MTRDMSVVTQRTGSDSSEVGVDCGPGTGVEYILGRCSNRSAIILMDSARTLGGIKESANPEIEVDASAPPGRAPFPTIQLSSMAEKGLTAAKLPAGRPSYLSTAEVPPELWSQTAISSFGW